MTYLWYFARTDELFAECGGVYDGYGYGFDY